MSDAKDSRAKGGAKCGRSFWVETRLSLSAGILLALLVCGSTGLMFRDAPDLWFMVGAIAAMCVIIPMSIVFIGRFVDKI